MVIELQRFIKDNINRLSYSTWIDLNKKYLYVETPKVGCTSIKVNLQILSGFQLPSNIMQIHYRNPPESYVKSISFFLDELDFIFSDTLFKFAFVRNPFSRSVSAYKDKILNSRGKFWESYRSAIRIANNLKSNENILFAHFIDYVFALPDSQRDSHWRSQYNLLRPDIIPYDFIGKLETFAEDFSFVLANLNSKNYSTEDRLKINQTEKTKLESFYDIDLAKKVFDIYKKDFDFFGYSKTLMLDR